MKKLFATNVPTDEDVKLETFLSALPKEPGFSISVINDCGDRNEQLRITTHLQTLFDRTPVSFCEVQGLHADLEAAGCLIDAIDAKFGGTAPGIILPNVAFRHPEVSGDANGAPFAYIVILKLLIISTIRGRTLSLLKHFYGIESVRVFEPREVLESIVATGHLGREWVNHIAENQFRSFVFQPLAAARLCQGFEVPYRKENLACPAPGSVVWFVDKHGNCKTTVTTEMCEPFPKDGDTLATKFGNLPYFRRLTDAPLGKPAVTTGSSGLGAGPNDRFLEIAVRMGNAAKELRISVGSEVF
ncbi:MAG: SAM-dependent chlorinase/fluorinase [bacterium]|nr:SAM-dependent chlorinase/fluorinase [bacterium]